MIEGHPLEHGRALADAPGPQAGTSEDQVRLRSELEARKRELTEAVEQQAATSEILHVISRSRNDAQPVFDTIVASAARLCDANFALAMLHDRGWLSLAARTPCTPEFADFLARGFYATPDTASGRVVLERRPVQVIDFMDEPGIHPTPAHRIEGVRTVMAVPMMRDDRLLGAIAIWRREVRPFTDRQIALLQTFADQAVIALENVRLFRELEARNQELTEALEQQKATSEILRVISRSPAEVQPLLPHDLQREFDAIAAAALKLCDAASANLFTFDGELVHVAALAMVSPEGAAAVRRLFPRPPDRGLAASRAVLTRGVVAIHDTHADPDYELKNAEQWGFRSVLSIPLMRDGQPIGAIAVGRREPGPFSDKLISLLQTFADQAVIALENVRLFDELETRTAQLEDKSRQLEVASRHKSAFLANMSHELRTPLNAIIGFTRIVMRRSQERLERQQYDNLEKILASAQNLLSLINAILDLAKVEAGRVELTPTEVRVGSVLEQCIRTVEPLLAGGVALVRDFDPELPSLEADEEKLRQIVMNLLSNAAKFTPRGTVQVRARSANGALELAVIDTGTGIAADRLDVIFEEFEQADPRATLEHGGTGLGLAIARRLARLMGGDIRVTSALGVGSTFTLRLPARHRSA
jgi:signal transduction histidine kinase